MTSLPRSTILRRRASRRGAAMVEAALVIPVMLVFMGCIMFTYRAYASKLDRQMAVRGELLSFASNGCRGTPPANFTSSAETPQLNDEGAGADQASTTAGKVGGQSSAISNGLKKSFWMAHAAPADTYVLGSTRVRSEGGFMLRVPFLSKIHAESEVVCNQESSETDTNALIDQVGRSRNLQ